MTVPLSFDMSVDEPWFQPLKSSSPARTKARKTVSVGGQCQRRRQRTTAAAAAAGAAAASDDGGVFLFKPQRCALLNKYSGSDGREAAPRGQIVGGG